MERDARGFRVSNLGSILSSSWHPQVLLTVLYGRRNQGYLDYRLLFLRSSSQKKTMRRKLRTMVRNGYGPYTAEDNKCQDAFQEAGGGKYVVEHGAVRRVCNIFHHHAQLRRTEDLPLDNSSWTARANLCIAGPGAGRMR